MWKIFKRELAPVPIRHVQDSWILIDYFSFFINNNDASKFQGTFDSKEDADNWLRTFGGFKSYEGAVKWLNEYGNKDGEYFILAGHTIPSKLNQ